VGNIYLRQEAAKAERTFRSSTLQSRASIHNKIANVWTSSIVMCQNSQYSKDNFNWN